MFLATFLEKRSLDRAPRRFANYLFSPKHPKADVLLTTVLGPLCCELWSGMGRVHNSQHDLLFVFSRQHALKVHPIGHTCSIIWYILDRFRILIHILLVLAADTHLIRIQEVAAKFLSDKKNDGAEYIW